MVFVGEGEDNVSLKRAISKLSELESKLEQVHMEQADNDLFTFGETIKDYISIIQSAKVNCVVYILAISLLACDCTNKSI